jgi:hypothetical protein
MMKAKDLRHRSWLEWMARVGYAARGLVFAIVGIFAGLAAIGARSRAGDSKDALHSLLSEPFGQVLLAMMAVGLACFATWRLAQAVLDADHQGTNSKALIKRAIYVGAAVFYLGFAWVAVTMVFGWDRSGNSDQIAREWTAWVLAKPFGQWMIGAVGIVFVTTAIGVAITGFRADFKRRLEMKKEDRKIVTALGSLGFFARAFVFATIDSFSCLPLSILDRAKQKGLPARYVSSSSSPTARHCSASPPRGCSLSVFTDLPRQPSAGSHRPAFPSQIQPHIAAANGERQPAAEEHRERSDVIAWGKEASMTLKHPWSGALIGAAVLCASNSMFCEIS